MNSYNSIFFVGIKGVAMANLALICHEKGIHVAGSDLHEEFITDNELQQKGITIVYSFEGQQLPQGVDLVVYSAAHGGDKNPQVLEAKKRGITIIHQAVFLGQISSDYKKRIAVAGCHGKTTTSGMLAYALSTMGEKPGYMVGVSEFNSMPGGTAGNPDYFVIEADEYALNPPVDKTPKFHFLFPTHTIITNIDFDHPDVYRDIIETQEAFKTFIQSMKSTTQPMVVACGDDKNTVEVLKSCEPDTYVTYGFSPDSDITIHDVSTHETGMRFTLKSIRLDINETFTISLYGEKNVLNATGVIGMLRVCGFSLTQIQTAIENYTGAKRRFERLVQKEAFQLFDDYAHHPAEILSTIQAARARFPGRRLGVIFQPHTFTRTESLKHEFIKALSQADYCILAPIFGSARETISDTAITSKVLEEMANKQQIHSIYGCTLKEEIIPKLKELIRPDDILFTMGAGDIYKLKTAIEAVI